MKSNTKQYIISVYNYLKTLGGNRVSKKISSPFEGNSVATAMYDALKREITGSMVFSLSFVGAGLIVFILGLVKYFSITRNLVDSSENYDACAWLVIAGVGLIVGAIGIINILKSMVSLGTIGSSAKDAQSHASPFQTQKLNRKVTAMNQSQSLKSPGTEGMAENSGMSLRKNSKSKNKSSKRSASSDLYDKYNPQKKDGKANQPKQSEPMMEQKFDYGLNENKKMTFADEFLQKNKRDPFAQYRKDLGIKEEPKKVVEQKPQFIPSTPKVQASAQPVQSTQLTKAPQNQSVTNDSQPVQTASGLDLQLPTSQSTVFDESLISDEPQGLDLTLSEEITASDIDSQYQKSEEFNPYGQRRAEDEGLFFSARNQNTSVTQQTQQAKAQSTVKRVSSDGFKVDQPHRNRIEESNDDSTSLELEVSNTSNTGMYNFSLFEEIEPTKSKMYKSTVQIPSKPAIKQTETKIPSVSVNEDEQKNVTEKASKSKKDVEPLLMKTLADAEDSTEDALIFESMFDTDDDKDESEFFDNSINSDSNDEQESETSLSYDFDNTPIELHEVHNSIAHTKHADDEKAQEASSALSYSTSSIDNSVSEAPVASNNSEKYNFAAFEERPREKKAAEHTEQQKQSFSAMFLNRQKSKEQSQSNSTSSQTHEICTNGTRSQRKFVDASEYDEWSCSQCGKVNQEYVGVCACGSRKPRAKKH